MVHFFFANVHFQRSGDNFESVHVTKIIKDYIYVVEMRGRPLVTGQYDFRVCNEIGCYGEEMKFIMRADGNIV